MISDEQLDLDKALAVEVRALTGTPFAKWRLALSRMEDYISEVERLRTVDESKNKEIEKIVSEDYHGDDPIVKRMRALLAFLQLENEHLCSREKLLTDRDNSHIATTEKLQAENAYLNAALSRALDELESQRESYQNKIWNLECELQLWPDKLKKNAIEVRNESNEQVLKLWNENTELKETIKRVCRHDDRSCESVRDAGTGYTDYWLCRDCGAKIS